MKLHEATLTIPSKEVIEYDTLMSQSSVDLDMEGLPHMGNIKTWSVEFDNGNIFDLRVNTSDDDVWCEGIFLDAEETICSEMYVDDVRDTLLGTYEFTDDANNERYVVRVTTEETVKGEWRNEQEEGRNPLYVAVYVDRGECCDGKPNLLGSYATEEEARKAIDKDIDLWKMNNEEQTYGNFKIDHTKMSAWDEDNYDYGCEWKILKV
jgi:hypothetical protein